MNCIPEEILKGEMPNYESFLNARRRLLAAKLKTYFQAL
jgi:hypothetical protein